MKIKNRSPSLCKDTLDDFGDVAYEKRTRTYF